MKTPKFLFTVLLAVAMLATQAGSVFAAPTPVEGPITGTVTALECGMDTQGATTILVTLEDTEGVSQILTIPLASAQTLGLVSLDGAGLPDCSPEAFAAILEAAPESGLVVEIDPLDVLPGEEQPTHPVGYALSLFFADLADYDTIMQAHQDGTGFGVIAQALWMTMNMDGDAALFTEILTAKKTGDFSAFVLVDGSTPKNWGQLRKALLNDDGKNNLGTVMSDKDNKNDKDKTSNGKGPNKDKDNKGKDKDK